MLMLERTELLDDLIVEFAAVGRRGGAIGDAPKLAFVSELAVPGVRAGHWTGAATGVTVVLFPEGTVGSGEVRGGAPATREVALLEPTRVVGQVDAVVFTGGSAFGLATADGVMQDLAAAGRGYPTAGGPVPIVPTVAIYDLVESGARPPGPTEGRAAVVAAAGDEPLALGRVGAGRGATVGKWRGRDHAVPGGVGLAHARSTTRPWWRWRSSTR